LRPRRRRSGISDLAHFAYPTYAKGRPDAARQPETLADELKTQLEDAQAELGEAFEALKKVEIL
jgi:hypothetical protein